MSVAQLGKVFTVEEYYSRERSAPHKSDYYKGEIFAMAGGTIRHSTICTNLIGELRNRLKGRLCRPYESNLRLKNKVSGLRTYPDASVYRGPFEKDEEDTTGETVTNPTVLFEVLSPSTEAYDRGFKSADYRRIPSLKAYVLVWQDAPHIEIYERQKDGSWILREENTLTASVRIAPINVDLPLVEIYDDVNFNDALSLG